MSADFTPPLKPYSDINKFKFWCQKVLPIVYDDSLSYYEVLNKVVNYLNEVIENMDTVEDNVKSVYDAFVELQDYVNEYFDSQDWQSMVNNKIDELVIEGYFETVIEPLVTEDFNRIVVEFNEFKEEVNDDIDDFKEEVNGDIQTQNDNIANLVARMDTFASLPDGSTAGDAELTDIRVGFNSITYPSAGDAVRTCDNIINDKLTAVSNATSVPDYDSYFLRDITWTMGYMNKSGNVSASTSYHYSEPISVSEGDIILVIETDWRYLTAFYNGNAVSALGDEVHRTYTVPAGVDAVVISCGPGTKCVGHKVYKLSDILQVQLSDLTQYTQDLSNVTVREVTTSSEIGDTIDFYSGYCKKNGEISESSSYHYTDIISCKEGDVFTSTGLMRFVTACKDTIPVYESSAENVYTYTVPSDVNGLCITLEVSNTNIVKEYTGIINIINLPTDNILVKEIIASTFSDGETLVACSNIDNKKNDVISFYCNIDATDFNAVWIGHGKNVDSGSYVIVDDTNITVIRGNNTVYYTAPHNLTIDKFLSVVIKHTDTARASVLLTTASGSKFIDSPAIAWTGSRGDVFATSVNSSFSNVKLSSTFEDLNRPVYLFGDSYVGLGDNARYATQLINQGYTNILIDGWSGRASADGLTSFKNVIGMAKPKYAIWNLGMNNPDSGAINTSYKECLDDFIATCEDADIIPILSTIPNTPTRDHTYKNAYVKSLGYRYIDFATAVGAELVGSSWYTGMLSSDNVHPTELGAKALTAKFISDFPEIGNNI